MTNRCFGFARRAGVAALLGLGLVLAGGRAMAAPNRIVTLEFMATESVLALGVTPIGAADSAGYRGWVSGQPLPTRVTDVGTRQEPSLEAIASLKPDLIIGPAMRLKPIEARLQSLATTVLLEGYPKDPAANQLDFMLSEFRRIGEILGRAEAAEKVIQQLDSSLAAHRVHLAVAGRSGAVLVAQYLPGTPRLRVFTNNSQVGTLLARLGLTNAWTAPNDVYGFSTVTAEALAPVTDATLLIIANPADTGWQALQTGAVWQALAPVRAGRERLLDPKTWTFGGPVSAQVLGDEIAAALQR
ncbi:ABC transporter substrate-binding protein [Elstera sp.]|jgi:iron complex transport system substrate-binding protein|uniref:ABC transporter substrate-binding protein n=1 Tax=Elstera sp. TaxID=1916664 RepID=UPI0037BEFC57